VVAEHLVARANELASIDAAPVELDPARARAIALLGEAGIGKRGCSKNSPAAPKRPGTWSCTALRRSSSGICRSQCS